MFLEGAQALLLYPVIKKKLAHLPRVQEQLVAALQGPLILADVSRVARFVCFRADSSYPCGPSYTLPKRSHLTKRLLITFLHLPVEVRYDPTAWTFVITSTALICPILVAIRYVAQFLMSMGRAGHFGPDAQVGLVRWLRTLSTLLSVQDRLKRVLQTPWTTDT